MRRDLPQILNIFLSSNKKILIAGLLINIPLTIILAYRLKIIMAAQSLYLSLSELVNLIFIGYFFNNFLPTAIGGDIAKAYYASKRTKRQMETFAAVFVDRFFGLIAIIIIALCSILFLNKNLPGKKILIMMFLIAILFIMFIIFLTNKGLARNIKGLFSQIKIGRLEEPLRRFYNVIYLYREHPILAGKALFISIFLQAASIFMVYLFIISLGTKVPLLRLFFIMPVIWAVSMLPSLNGLGIREGAFVYFLSGWIGKEKAFATSLLWLGLIFLFSIIGGVLHLVNRNK